ncbi:MAG: heat-inducible transcriptional repressor HrcA [Candidatus Cloacimonadota bacterium]|nr:heat-inducible transcriptional repressor HrcA [Candidatus Cloacimonadota bacterium]
MKKSEIRRDKVLKNLVEEYIESVEPVSSKLICEKYVKDISPATIRIDLNKLENENYLYQQHTSGGRIPTIKGYRKYIKMLSSEIAKTKYENLDVLRGILVKYYDDTPLALHYIMRYLAKETDQLSFVAEPEVSYGYLSKLDVFKISEKKLLFVVSLDSGIDKTVILNCDYGINQTQLRTIVKYVNEELMGRRIYDIQNRYLNEIASKISEENKILRSFMEELQKALIEISKYYIHFDGNISFLELPEFDKRTMILKFLGFMQRQDHLVSLMQKCQSGRPYYYLLGEDLGEPDLSNYALLFAKYKIFGVPGYLGVLGPSRMDYRRNIPLLRDFAKVITNSTNKGLVVSKNGKK